MNRSKKIFLGIAIAFFAFLLGVIYDISRKTTFPGAKNRNNPPREDVAKDTAKSNLPPKSTTQQR